MLVPRSHAVLRSVLGVPVRSRHPRAALNIDLFTARPHVRFLSALSCRLPIQQHPSVLVRSHGLRGLQRQILRGFSSTCVLRQEKPESNQSVGQSKPLDLEENPDLEYKRTEKAEAAKSVDLSARLQDRSTPSEKGEVIRLLKLAGREWKTLSGITRLPPLAQLTRILTHQWQLSSFVFPRA
jgi:hypothetical protein